MGKSFSNPWPSYKKLSVRKVLLLVSLRCGKTRKPCLERIPETQVADFKFSRTSPHPRVMWLGHASVLLQLPRAEDDLLKQPIGILFDPIFSQRCSPVSWMGPKRRLAPPTKVKDLPTLHAVVISHDHYDHLDKRTIQDIEIYHGATVEYFAPTGVKAILVKYGIPESKVHEMGWWEQASCHPSNDASWSRQNSRSSSLRSFSVQKALSENARVLTVPVSTSSKGERACVRLTCTPAQHNSGRSVCKQNKTLWATWHLAYDLPDGEPWRCFFGGDTGYQTMGGGPECPVFKDVRERYGRPDLALLPVSEGATLQYLSSMLPLEFDSKRLVSAVHSFPEEAIKIHQDLGARCTLPIHWGTWTTKHGAEMLARELRSACGDEKVDLRWGSLGHEGFGVSDVGVWMETSS